ncbi:MAG: hypothetical protein ACFCUN_01270 [Hyphomicrobiaceae bacterium]
MPLQNRVTPEGEIIETAARGTLMGNRGGMLHRPDKTLGLKRWINKSWISCRLQFKGRWREVMGPDSYTELFFLDEATALAAGHRPCYECRRNDATWFAELWGKALAEGRRAKASEIDGVLHEERLTADGAKATFRSIVGDLPTGVMVRWNGACYLVFGRRLMLWSPERYVRAVDVPIDQVVDVLTPRSIVEVIRAGYDPDIHGSVLELA